MKTKLYRLILAAALSFLTAGCVGCIGGGGGYNSIQRPMQARIEAQAEYRMEYRGSSDQPTTIITGKVVVWR